MKIIYNNIIPFKGYKAINLFGILFVRKCKTMKDTDLNHEAIHTAQMREMLYVLFYLWYAVEWLLRLIWNKFQGHKAYRAIGFEREAYSNQSYLKYLDERQHYSWLDYLVEHKI